MQIKEHLRCIDLCPADEWAIRFMFNVLYGGQMQAGIGVNAAARFDLEEKWRIIPMPLGDR